MTTIPSLNVVVQQSNSAIEAQNLRNPAHEASHAALVEQPKKEMEERSSVQKTDYAEHAKSDNKNSGNKDREEEERERKKKEKDLKAKNPDGLGKLLDTVA